MKFVWETPEEIDKALAQRLSRIRKRRNLSESTGLFIRKSGA